MRPILESRCVVCHACYNAPCQLNQQTWDGLDRGGNKEQVYDASRLASIRPTRMFQDAKTSREWREKFAFFPVVSHSRDPVESVLHHFIAQRRADPRAGDFDADRKPECPDTVDAAKAYLAKRPEAGMPYGFPALDDAQFRAIEAWLAEGAPPPPPAPLPGKEIVPWEEFLDGDDLRTQLVARYLYEHLFLAHLHFGERTFYRLVRSRTGLGQPVDEIVTDRPFDDPKVARVHYRLVRLNETIVRKTHVPFELSDAKLARIRALFLAPKWAVEALPPPSANPFVTFAAIPARARYQFMLDDAYYHVRAFIHGPVCKSQVALNVIDEHFWITFLAPDSDLSVTSPEFLNQTAEDLRVPAEGGDGLEAIYSRFHASQLRYVKARAARYGARAMSIDDVWAGNRDALLTVYRHFDSASVSRGALGATPKTGWVLDYPTFERIYYDLVAGFNVFGNVVHQVSTRRYMDNLRVEAEDGFLRFLPRAERPKLHAAWYRGAGVAEYEKLFDPPYDAAIETKVAYRNPADAKAELWAQVKARMEVKADRAAEPPLRALADVAGPWVALFPDVTFLRSGHEVFSLARNKAHLNIAFMFLEDAYRAPQEDGLSVVRGFIGSYPNLYLEVPVAKQAQFVAQVQALRVGDDSWSRLMDAYGVRRSSPDFWRSADWFNAAQLLEEPIEGGVIDLGRYLSQ